MNWNRWLELQKKGYSLDIIYLLSNIENYNDKDANNPKIPIIVQSLIRKGLLTSEHKITLEGKELLAFVESKEENVKLVKKKKEDEFDKWWEAYPRSDNFEYKGKTFDGGRGIRVGKENCKIKIKAILNEGKYTIDDLIRALEFEIFQKKEKSYKENKNHMSFMQNSLTYLNQGTYMNFIEISKKKQIDQTFDGINI